MKRFSFYCFVVCFYLLSSSFSLHVFAQYGSEKSDKFDKRVKNALDELDYKYEITDKGNFKLVLKIDDTRTQLVVIRSSTYDYDNIEVREIYAPAAKGKDKSSFSQKVLFGFLQDNAVFKMGGWQMDGSDDEGYLLNFGLRADAETSSKILKKLLTLAATQADKMEKIISGDDKY